MSKKNSLPVRALAAQVILQVSGQGQSLNKTLLAAQQQLTNSSEGALLQEMCYGSLRWFYRLDAVASLLLNKPLKERDHDIFCLLLVGLYQLEFTNIPHHAVIKETVNAVLAMRKSWAKGLVNALLREYQRNAVQLNSELEDDEEARYAHPLWMIESIKKDWPQYYHELLNANNERPPMALRVNRQVSTVDVYQQKLQQQGIQAQRSTYVESALILDQAKNVFDLPGFNNGEVSVQDSSAQLAATLMRLAPGQRVLDACSAPGGKTVHMLETCPSINMQALDIDQDRLLQVQENLERAKLSAELITGDAADPSGWWDGKPFDRMLIDAPCSGSGVIRRHPDIKLLRSLSDIDELVKRQTAILEALWPLLAPGGMLVYSTCSVFRQENERQIKTFLSQHDDALELVLDVQWGYPCEPGRQILPDQQGMDGFFYACVQKKQ